MVDFKNNQVKTKKRVADHGEVFTHEREVNGMLDLVKNETERIDFRFLEPACGTGNFSFSSHFCTFLSTEVGEILLNGNKDFHTMPR